MHAALTVLGFLDLSEDQVPPEEYWHSHEHIEDWFKAVKQRSADRARGMESIDTGEELADGYQDSDVANLR